LELPFLRKKSLGQRLLATPGLKLTPEEELSLTGNAAKETLTAIPVNLNLNTLVFSGQIERISYNYLANKALV